MDQIKLLDGRSFRVEVNWNAIVAFLESSGRDDVRELSNLSTLKPSDLAGLLAAGIHEGERLEGNEVNFTAEEIGTVADFSVMGAFVRIFTKQMTPKGPVDEKKE